LPVLERIDRFAERVGEALGVGLVGVALERRRQLELVLDSVKAGSEHRGERKVGVYVPARDSRLGAQPVAVADDAEAAGAVVVPPGQGRRRPAPGRVALVGVHVRRKEEGELAEAGDLPGEELLEDRGLARERALVAAPEA